MWMCQFRSGSTQHNIKWRLKENINGFELDLGDRLIICGGRREEGYMPEQESYDWCNLYWNF